MSSANWDRKSTSRAREAEKQSIAISLIWSAESYWGLEAAFQLDVPKICIFFAPVWNGARRWVVNGLMVERDLHVGSNLTLFWFTKIYCEFVLICIWFFTSLTCFLFFWLFHVAEQCVKAPEVNGISVFHLKQRSLTQHANAARYRSSWRHRVSELACQHCARLRSFLNNHSTSTHGKCECPAKYSKLRMVNFFSSETLVGLDEIYRMSYGNENSKLVDAVHYNKTRTIWLAWLIFCVI